MLPRNRKKIVALLYGKVVKNFGSNFRNVNVLFPVTSARECRLNLTSLSRDVLPRSVAKRTHRSGRRLCAEKLSTNLVPLGRPVARLGERQLTADVLVGDVQLAVLVDPALAAEQVVDAGRHLVPGVGVARSRQQQVDLAQGLELHALAPEFGLDARVLPECEVAALRVARAHRRMVRHLDAKQIARCQHFLIRKRHEFK